MAKDFIDIKNRLPDAKKLYRAKNVEEEQKHVRARKPYCFRCAKQDFEDKIDDSLRKVIRDRELNEDDYKLDVNSMDLSKYGAKDRFKLLAEQEEVDTVLLPGRSKKSEVIGTKQIFQCKDCGAKITVSQPLQDDVIETKQNKTPVPASQGGN